MTYKMLHRKSVEGCKIDTPKLQIHDRWLSWLAIVTGTSDINHLAIQLYKRVVQLNTLTEEPGFILFDRMYLWFVVVYYKLFTFLSVDMEILTP
jgi:hypothetical protein